MDTIQMYQDAVRCLDRSMLYSNMIKLGGAVSPENIAFYADTADKGRVEWDIAVKDGDTYAITNNADYQDLIVRINALRVV